MLGDLFAPNDPYLEKVKRIDPHIYSPSPELYVQIFTQHKKLEYIRLERLACAGP